MLTKTEIMERIDQLNDEREEMDGRKTKDIKHKKEMAKLLAEVAELDVAPENVAEPTNVSIFTKQVFAKEMQKYEEKYSVEIQIDWTNGGEAEIAIDLVDHELGGMDLVAVPFENEYGNPQFEYRYPDGQELRRQLGWTIRDHYGLELEQDDEEM